MFQIMTDGFVLSRHETRAGAEARLLKERAESRAEINRLLDSIQESEDFAASLTIETA